MEPPPLPPPPKPRATPLVWLKLIGVLVLTLGVFFAGRFSLRQTSPNAGLQRGREVEIAWVWQVATNQDISFPLTLPKGMPEWLKDSGNAESRAGRFFRSLLALQRGDFSSAQEILSLPAREGATEALVLLAKLNQAWTIQGSAPTNALATSDTALLQAALLDCTPAEILLAERYLGLDAPTSLPRDPQEGGRWAMAAGTADPKIARTRTFSLIANSNLGIKLSPPDLKLAADWASKPNFAQLHHASFLLALDKLQSATNAIQLQTATNLLQKAVALGSPEAHFALGKIFFDGLLGKPDYRQARASIEAAGKQGVLGASLFMASWSYYGKGDLNGNGNLNDAIEWVTAPAAAGIPEAEFLTGLICLRTQKDGADRALPHFDEAARAGHAYAQLYQAVLLERAASTSYNYDNVVRLYEAAAAQGVARAKYALALIKRAHIVYDDAPRDSWTLLREAADQQYPLAQLELARAYESGNGVKPSMAEAMRWYRLAAESGVAEACDRLAEIYSTGTGWTGVDKQIASTYEARAKELREFHEQNGSSYF